MRLGPAERLVGFEPEPSNSSRNTLTLQATLPKISCTNFFLQKQKLCYKKHA